MTAPVDWPVVRLDAVGTVVTGSTPPTSDRSFYGRDCPFVSPADLGRTKHIRATAKMLSAKGFARSRCIPAGSTLFVCIGSTIGKVGLARCDLVTNQQINSIIPNGTVDPEFLYYASTMLSAVVREQAGEQAVPLVNKSQFSGFEIPLPPSSEQRAIARALADADDLIFAMVRRITKKQAIKQGMIQQLLTGRTRLPGFDRPWATERLADLGVAVRGVSYKPEQDLSARRTPFTVDLLRANNVLEGTLNLSGVQHVDRRRVRADQYLREGDILVCAANGSKRLVGKAAPVRRRHGVSLTFGAFMMVYRPNQTLVLPSFAALHFQTKPYRDWIEVLLAGSSINNLRPSDLTALEIPLPGRDEQSAIAAALADVDDEIEHLYQRLEKARDIKQGMMQQLLTGRIRLPMEEAVA